MSCLRINKMSKTSKYPDKPYTKDWGYVDNIIDTANRLGFSPALTHLAAAKWAGEGGRKPRVGSLGLSMNEKRLVYPSLERELSAYKDTVAKILKSKGKTIDEFNNADTEALFDAIQYRPEGKVAGKDYYMFNDVRGDSEYKKLITDTPEYKYFNQDYVKGKLNASKPALPKIKLADGVIPSKTIVKKPNPALLSYIKPKKNTINTSLI